MDFKWLSKYEGNIFLNILFPWEKLNTEFLSQNVFKDFSKGVWKSTTNQIEYKREEAHIV